MNKKNDFELQQKILFLKRRLEKLDNKLTELNVRKIETRVKLKKLEYQQKKRWGY